ncbi:MAG TPA: type IV pili twitching motility protein PilT, partial [Dokdonella sp.]
MDISDLLAQMSTEHASDLYLSHGAPPAIVVAGVSRYIGDKALTPIDTHEIAYSVMSDRQQKEFEATLEMNLGIAPAGLGRFRVNVYRQRGEVALAIRYIPTEIPSIQSLRLPSMLQSLIMLPRGLILVVGSTGSGKSTTL